MNERELSYLPIKCQWLTAGNNHFIDFSITAPRLYHKPVRVNPKLLTAMKHAHGKRITASRSEVKHKVFMLLYCQSTVTLTLNELEEDTVEIAPSGDTQSSNFPLYKYLLEMLNLFIKEVANECDL